jgi:hypothetical protein
MARPSRDKHDPDEPVERRNRTESMAAMAAQFARPFQRAGFTDPTLVLHWNEIAGPDIARIASPLKLSEGPQGGSLTLAVEPAAQLFLQHQTRELCGRINAYLGREAVCRIRLQPGRPAPSRAQEILPLRKPGPLPPLSATDPAAGFSGAGRLKAALRRLAALRHLDGRKE